MRDRLGVQKINTQTKVFCAPSNPEKTRNQEYTGSHGSKSKHQESRARCSTIKGYIYLYVVLLGNKEPTIWVGLSTGCSWAKSHDKNGGAEMREYPQGQKASQCAQETSVIFVRHVLFWKSSPTHPFEEQIPPTWFMSSNQISPRHSRRGPVLLQHPIWILSL